MPVLLCIKFAKRFIAGWSPDWRALFPDFCAKAINLDVNKTAEVVEPSIKTRDRNITTTIPGYIYRIYLRTSGENRLAKMMDSPYHPYSDTRFTINEKGADDIEEDSLIE